MADNRIVVNSDKSMERACDELRRAYQRGRYVIISWQFGSLASREQKALLKIWIRQVAAHLMKKSVKQVSADEVERMTRSIKKRFYQETGESFAVKSEPDPLHPDKKVLEVTSSATWTHSECHRVMEWLQMTASTEYDLILESRGEHNDMKRGQYQ